MEAIRFNDQIEDVPLNIFGTCQTTLLCLGRAPLKNATISLNCRDMLPDPTQSITPYQSCLPKCFRTRYPCVNLRARRSLRFSFFIRSMSLMLERFSENLAGLVSSTSSRVRTDSAQCLQMVPVSMRSSCETSATIFGEGEDGILLHWTPHTVMSNTNHLAFYLWKGLGGSVSTWRGL